MNFLKNIKFGRPSIRGIIFWVITIALVIGGFIFTRSMVTCWTITPLPGWTPSNCGTVNAGLSDPVLNEQGTPIATEVGAAPTISAPANAPDANIPPAWDGASRINVLIIGLDYRDWTAGEGAPRSDTMIVLTIDPLTKTAGMMSVPRDMWVNIPGFGYSRINTAYSDGEGAELPGGGPALATKTVEQFLGIPIQYYAEVDFYTFIDFIDMIGGIDVYSDQKLVLDPIGEGKDHKVVTCCGMRHMNGEIALAYARTRHTENGDVDRAKRQQRVILGIRNKVLDPQNFPTLIAKSQDFYNELSSGIKTNMPFETAVQLAVLAKDIPVESIKQGVIDYTMVTLDNVTLGGQAASIMKPMPDKIRELRDQIFTSTGPLSPIAQGDPTALMKADGARVRILNASGVNGLDAQTGNYFLAQGMSVLQVGTASQQSSTTTIILHSPKLYTLKYLQAVFGITSAAQIQIAPDASAPVDVEVILGSDWANHNPMQ